METKSLVFVYKADSGMFNLLADIAHKIFSPQTYACQLCSITHGNLKMHEEWRTFIHSLPIACDFMHRDEFLKVHSEFEDELPAVYLRSTGKLQLCVNAKEINQCENLLELKNLIQSTCVVA
jgi:hypothetical protein